MEPTPKRPCLVLDEATAFVNSARQFAEAAAAKQQNVDSYLKEAMGFFSASSAYASAFEPAVRRPAIFTAPLMPRKPTTVAPPAPGSLKARLIDLLAEHPDGLVRGAIVHKLVAPDSSDYKAEQLKVLDALVNHSQKAGRTNNKQDMRPIINDDGLYILRREDVFKVVAKSPAAEDESDL